MCPDSRQIDQFQSRRSTVYADNGLVATSQPLAARAALRRLEDGGNAFDAAVTAATVLNVVEPTSTGIGGDVLALYRTADGDVGGLQSCGPAPREASIDAVANALDEEDPSMPFLGPHTVTVPGAARGWETLLRQFGKGTLREALEPAITYAYDGFPVSEVIAYHWKSADDLFTSSHARETFVPNGTTPTPGDRVKLPALAESLERVARKGADAFYEGQLADAIVSTVQDAGGFLTHDDLAAFEPTFVEPVSIDYHGTTVYELPPPNQGIIALLALRIAESIGASSHPLHSADQLHEFVEAMKLAYTDGHHWITDPNYFDMPPLLDSKWVADRAQRIGSDPLDHTELPPPGPEGEDGDTVLVTVGDADGRLVSLLNSRFAGFGSGLVAEGTGIALQNRGASFSLDSTHPNALEPEKRPFHTLIPCVAEFGEDDWAALGVMGGHMQPQGHFQLLTNLIDFDLELQEALDAPRWRYRDDGTISIEPRIAGPTLTELVRKGHSVEIGTPSTFGGAQIVRNRNGVLSGATEPRKDGVAIGF